MVAIFIMYYNFKFNYKYIIVTEYLLKMYDFNAFSVYSLQLPSGVKWSIKSFSNHTIRLIFCSTPPSLYSINYFPQSIA